MAGYRKVILFLDLADRVKTCNFINFNFNFFRTCNFKLVQTVITAYFSKKVGVVCLLCMWYIDFPGLWHRNYIFNFLTDIKNIMLLRYLWEAGTVQFFFFFFFPQFLFLRLIRLHF